MCTTISNSDPYNLNRFVEAQESYYGTALQEIRNGQKQSHWIWFIFPQMKGLGHSSMSQNYGITSLDEAKAYLAHPILREHLTEIIQALLMHKDKTSYDILGHIDAIKVRSCMTLFDLIEPNTVFAEVLDIFYNGKRDGRTIQIITNK